MPDLMTVFFRRWKFILLLSFLATLVAYVACLLSPKEYLAIATALPANSMTADKARIFNQNIEALYSEIGTADDLDRLEGTAVLDTLFIAAEKEFGLAKHYELPESSESWYKAVIRLKKNTRIARSAYGELKVKVWDEDRNLSAGIANFLMNGISAIHQHLQNESNQVILDKITEDYKSKQQAYMAIADSGRTASGGGADLLAAKKNVLFGQLQDYEKMMDQYRLAIRTNVPVLLMVEAARPPLWPDKPRKLEIVLLTFVIALVCTFLVAVLIESRK